MQLLETVPNFSEGLDENIVNQIANCFANRQGVKLLHFTMDIDHNRSVVTAIGQPLQLCDALIDAVGVATKLIDLNKHKGEHPFVGASDVIPLVPLGDMTVEQAKYWADYVAKSVYEKFGVPSYFYEQSATNPLHANLANVRKGGYKNLPQKVTDKDWQLDYGKVPHPTAGVSVIGVRKILVAFNVNLTTADTDIAWEIAKTIRYIGGGLRCLKAIGINLANQNCAQVSMNLTDYTTTPLYVVYELILALLKKYHVCVKNSEAIGLIPYEALRQCAEFCLLKKGKTKAEVDMLTPKQVVNVARRYLKLDGFDDSQVLDFRIKDCEFYKNE